MSVKVKVFDVDKGIYLSSVTNVETEYHSHPAIEVIHTRSDGLTIDIGNYSFENTRFAVLDSNTRHRVIGRGGEVDIFMIEYRDFSVRSILRKYNMVLDKGVYINSENRIGFHFEDLIADLHDNADTTGYDTRVVTAINWLNRNDVSYSQLIGKLLSEVYLSESRLAHLFKADTGVSLKRYLVWCKLKRTIAAHLHKELDLYSAMIHSGFYDQAHFSKSYKSLIGISPSKVYK